MTFQLTPTDFYDYDMTIASDGIERYHLCMNGQRLPIGRCVITVETSSDGERCFYSRLTQWRSRHGRRREVFDDLDKAMRSGIAWAIRRQHEEAAR